MSNWFKTWWDAAPVTFIVVLVGIIAALVLTVWAIITKGGWKDAGFMKRNGKELRLPKVGLPWAITVESSFPQMYMDALDSVVDSLVRAGVTVFSRVVRLKPGETPANIKVMVAEDSAISTPGTTKHQFDERTGEILSAFVSVKPGMMYGDMIKIMGHELGHVMGLDHDEHVSSVMYPTLQQRPQSFTDKDISRLKKAYG